MELLCYKSKLKLYKATINSKTFEIIIYENTPESPVVAKYKDSNITLAESKMWSEFERLEMVSSTCDGTLFSKLLQNYLADKSKENLEHLQTFLFLLKKMEYTNKKLCGARYYSDIIEGYGVTLQRGHDYLKKE